MALSNGCAGGDAPPPPNQAQLCAQAAPQPATQRPGSTRDDPIDVDALPGSRDNPINIDTLPGSSANPIDVDAHVVPEDENEDGGYESEVTVV